MCPPPAHRPPGVRRELSPVRQFDRAPMPACSLTSAVNVAASRWSSSIESSSQPRYHNLVAGKTLTVSDLSKGVIANDVNIYGVKVSPPDWCSCLNGVTQFTLNTNGTLRIRSAGTTRILSRTAERCDVGCGGTTVTIGRVHYCFWLLEAGQRHYLQRPHITNVLIDVHNPEHQTPGILVVLQRRGGLFRLTVNTASVSPSSGLTLSVDPNAVQRLRLRGRLPTASRSRRRTRRETVAAAAATVTLTFPTATGLT